MSLIITRNLKRAKAQDAAAGDKTPDGWWEGKTIFAAFGWGKSVKGKVVSHKGGVIKLEDGTKFKESDVYDLYAIDSSASDAAAQDIQLPFIITFNNGKKEFREGYSEEEVRRRFDKSVAALYGGIKSVKLEGEDKRNGKDSCATDAKFKVGDKVRRGVQTGIVRDIEKEPYIEVKFTDQPVTVFVRESELVAADSCAADVKDAAEKGSRELQNVFYGALNALKKVADRAKVEGAQTLVDAANSAAKELTSKSYTVF